MHERYRRVQNIIIKIFSVYAVQENYKLIITIFVYAVTFIGSHCK